MQTGAGVLSPVAAALLLIWIRLLALTRGAPSNIGHSISAGGKVEVYYINMASSVERRRNMEHQLRKHKLKYFRVEANVWSTIYVPPDVSMFWSLPWCVAETAESIPERSTVLTNTSSHLYNFSSIMAGLCGRGSDKNGKPKNTIKELGCTTSHIMAMNQAIYSNTSNSRYALVLEDDVKFVFDIDFEALAGSAPAGFGMLQLFNSNKNTMEHTLLKYSENPGNKLWFRNNGGLVYWSTCAYLIDREVMRPIIDKLMYSSKGWRHFKVIAGKTEPCNPQPCCVEGEGKHTRWGLFNATFTHTLPCVFSPNGFQADSFLYSLAPTYVLAVPVFTNGKGGNASTFHQDHVELLHRDAFRAQRRIVNDMMSGKVIMPGFLNNSSSSTGLLDEYHI